MAVEYDVVIIGASSAGIDAAVTAANLKARVALVDQLLATDPLAQTQSRAFSHLGWIAQQLHQAKQLGVHWQPTDSATDQAVSIQLAKALPWTEEVVSTLQEQHAPAVLAALGIEVILGTGEFCRRPHLAFVVNGRLLRSRAYLIATGSQPLIPAIEGLQTVPYLTCETIWQQTISQQLPESLVIIGDDATAVELAQTLGRLGVCITLLVKGSRILISEDAEAAHLIQAQLEAEGVRVLTEAAVTQVKQIQDKKWIQVGKQAIAADAILLATQRQPQVESLNLAAVGVKWSRHGIQVNDKLQTTNPQIYACGDVLGGYPFTQVASYEARIALKNALFFRRLQVDYQGIAWAILTRPALARVGLTEAQARQRYGNEIVILRQYFKTIEQAQIRGETTGFCKLVVHCNGDILGAHLVGPEAGELIGAIALAMRQKLKVEAIANLVPVTSTLSEIIHQTAAQWHDQRLNRNPGWQNFLEGFFTLRRSWSS